MAHMMTTASLIDGILANPVRALSNQDVEALMATDTRPLLVDKVLAVHFFRSNRLDDALALSQSVLSQEPSSENAKNVLHILTKSRAFEAAVQFASEHQGIIEPILFEDMMCMLFNTMGNTEKAVEHGTRALILKDAAAADITAPPVDLPAFDPADRTRNIIAMSLYGSDARYFVGARNNVIVSRYLYPGWTLRIYVDPDFSHHQRSELIREGAQIFEVGNWPAASHGLFWRFLVEDDEAVNIYLVRDADSVMNIRERMAVEAWLASDRAFHVMRDNPQHSELILAGMWGARRDNIGQMQNRIDNFLSKAPIALNNATIDQQFLRQEIWPIVKHSVLCHDAYLRFGETHPFPLDSSLPPYCSVGQNDWVNYTPTAAL